MELLPLGPESAEEVSAMAYRLFPEVYAYESKDIVDEFLEQEQSPGSIRRQMSEGMRYFLVRVDGEVAGYAAWGMDGDAMVFSKLYLFEGFRGRGIGSRVMDAMESDAAASGAGLIRLDVNRGNSAAISLYEGRGFTARGVFGLGNRRLLMEKELSD